MESQAARTSNRLATLNAASIAKISCFVKQIPQAELGNETGHSRSRTTWRVFSAITSAERDGYGEWRERQMTMARPSTTAAASQ